jgi:choline monooxygenase
MSRSPDVTAEIAEIVRSYKRDLPLTHASTIPARWYVDQRILDLERRTVFANAWQLAGRVEQVAQPGQFISCELPGGEPVLVVRGDDGILRGFFNVCRHHAAAVVTQPEGTASVLRCPYHGWTYALDGQLRGTPEFVGVCDFDRGASGLVQIDTAVQERWIFVRLERKGPSLEQFLGSGFRQGIEQLGLGNFSWMERRRYTLECNWKVFVDNYLDGGYHVPHLHKGLNSVLDYGGYTIENGERYCLQSSPMVSDGAEQRTAEVRSGDRAYYYWIYPNLMINCYAGAMDTNLVIPRAVDRTDVIFDFYFEDVSDQALARNRASIAVSEQIQDEDVSVCTSVQRGLRSRAFTTGRLSVRRESGEQLFHQLLYDDLMTGIGNRLADDAGQRTR